MARMDGGVITGKAPKASPNGELTKNSAGAYSTKAHVGEGTTWINSTRGMAIRPPSMPARMLPSLRPRRVNQPACSPAQTAPSGPNTRKIQPKICAAEDACIPWTREKNGTVQNTKAKPISASERNPRWWNTNVHRLAR